MPMMGLFMTLLTPLMRGGQNKNCDCTVPLLCPFGHIFMYLFARDLHLSCTATFISISTRDPTTFLPPFCSYVQYVKFHHLMC